MGIYSRFIQPLNTFLSLGSWVGWAISATGLTGAVLIAWASTTWAWYWLTFNFAGVAIAFLVAMLAFAVVALLLSLAFRPWRESKDKEKQKGTDDKIYQPAVLQSLPTLAAGLYVSDIRLTFDDLEKNRRAELTMRVFNGTGRVVEFANMSGQIKFDAPNNADPARKGVLPTPTLRHDVLKLCHPFQEWFFILEQRVPAQDADKLLAMLRDDVPIHFELAGLNISVAPQNDRTAQPSDKRKLDGLLDSN